MRCHRLLLTLVLLAAVARPAPAGILFGRHAKTNPAQRVPELLATVRTDLNEGKRASAARELREYDLTAFPDAVPVLIDVLQRDSKPGVRAEAAQTLSKIRPISQEAGAALEAAMRDPALRVRLQARSALIGYHMGGYHSTPKPNEAPAVPPAVNTTGPAGPPPPAQPRRFFAPSVSNPNPSLPPGETPPPPLAPPLPASPAGNASKPPAPVPPAEAPQLKAPTETTPPAPADQGPELPPEEQ